MEEWEKLTDPGLGMHRYIARTSFKRTASEEKEEEGIGNVGNLRL